MKINIEGNLIETTADSQLHVMLSGARGPQGLNGASLYIANDYTYRDSLPFEGYETFNVETGLSYTPGQDVVIHPTPGSSLNRSWGLVDSYDSETGELVIYVYYNSGNPNSSHWIINIAGRQGADGGSGETGQKGDKGDPGEGVASGGLEGQILAKASDSNYDTEWINAGVPYTGATGDVNLGEFGLHTGNIEFDNTPTNVPTTDGSMSWSDTDGTVNLRLKGGNVISKLGETQHLRVYNNTGVSMAKGKVVYVTGSQGQRLTVALADADTELLSKDTIGITAEAIADQGEGFIIIAGVLTNISTTGFLDGDTVFLSQTAGGYTKIPPSDPAHLVILGFVVKGGSGGAGSIYVKVDNGYELEELHNVADAAKTSIVDADAVLLRDSADNNLWKRLTWSNLKAAVKTYLDTFKGVAGGYASLDGSGKVPASELPSYVDDVIEVANYASLPVTGETGKIYITIDNNKSYRWSGSVYIEIAGTPVWGAITGTLSSQTDLQNALNAKQNSLTFDSTPTNGSTNPVTSDGVFDALALKSNKPVVATATLSTGSWSLVSGLQEQSISNVDITTSSVVDIIPDNAAAATVSAAQILPRTDSSSGAVKVYATNLPTANIGVTLNIWN